LIQIAIIFYTLDKKIAMEENFLHFIWKFQYFDKLELKTTQGEEVKIVSKGSHNFDAGPDFSTARIFIGNTEWVGNIEIHVKSSDWYMHQHQNNMAYSNVILHVVFDDNKPAKYPETENKIPTIELKDRINHNQWNAYQKIIASSQWIPCASQIHTVPNIYVGKWKERLLVERLVEKSKSVETLLQQSNNDWRKTFYKFLAKSFGFKVNSDPFEALANITDQSILSKYKNNQHLIEALLFGQAGFLNQKFSDSYSLMLQKDYKFLANKHGLVSLTSEIWKFSKIRPSNFPTIRIAQFAILICKSDNLLSQILEEENLNNLRSFFEVEINTGYWFNHFQFEKQSKERVKSLGKDAVNNILINNISVFLFFYGRYKKEQKFIDKALQLIEQIEPEQNVIIRNWTKLGLNSKNAFDTQSLIELKNSYCSKKKCLLCDIGNYILKPSLHVY
jgi:Protein of unknown function (DUF2851)